MFGLDMEDNGSFYKPLLFDRPRRCVMPAMARRKSEKFTYPCREIKEEGL